MKVHGLFEDGTGFVGDYDHIFIASDIHNDYMSYMKIKNENAWGNGDLLIINGDLIDRGGVNAKPVELLNEMVELTNNLYRSGMDGECSAIYLKGNHEQWLAQYLKKYIDGDVIEDYKYNSFSLMREMGLYDIQLELYAKWLSELHIGITLTIEGYDRPIWVGHASTVDFNDEEETIMGPGSNDKLMQMCNDKNCMSIVGHTGVEHIRFYMSGYSLSADDAKLEANKSRNDIYKVGSTFFIDCGNGYRDDPDFPGKLGYLELRDGNFIEHYV